MHLRIVKPNEHFESGYDVWLEQDHTNPKGGPFGVYLGTGDTEEAALRAASEALQQTTREIEARIRTAVTR